MITNRHHLALEMEFVKWFLLITFATIMALALATALAAGDRDQPAVMPPGQLPADMARLAKPLQDAPVRPYFPEDEPVIELPPHALAARVWIILEMQRAGLTAEALAAWREIRLPGQAEAWREVAMAAANLTLGRLERAGMNLDRAREYEHAQAVVAYYTGILRLEQATAAARVPDGLDPGHLRMVAYDPVQGPVGRVVLRALARKQLELAIGRANEILLDERLVTGPPGMEETVLAPCVGDLLVALEANNFVGKAHHLLFGLDLDRGDLRQAEEHLDLAVATGIAPLYGYADLAETYTAQEQPADAVRAAGKDIAVNHPVLREAGRECRELLEQVWYGWVW
jgi:hypothetical protein